MNKLVVVAKNPQTYFVKRLIEEVGQDVSFFNPWADALIPEASCYIVRTTGVYGSDLDLFMIQSLDQGKVLNRLSTLRLFRSKPLQYLWFEENNFPILHWLPIKGMDPLNIEKFFRLYPKMVVKPLIGQGGWGIELLTFESFKSWWKKKKGRDENYLLQPLIQGARELRYFFIKDECSLVLERTSKSGIAANFKRRGQAALTHLPSEFQSTIDLLIEKSGAHYGAIDLFIDDNRLIILELNTVPGLEQLEAISGQNIMRLLLNAKFFCHLF